MLLLLFSTMGASLKNLRKMVTSISGIHSNFSTRMRQTMIVFGGKQHFEFSINNLNENTIVF